MADEIDDLLDEVEHKFCSKKISNSAGSKKIRGPTKAEEDLNKIIDDICELPIEEDTHLRLKCDNTTASGKSPRERKKCFAVYLGGSTSTQGLSNSLSKQPCDALRCTSCDFKVAAFDNMEWSPNTDYLFLRNNAPDFHKLKSALLKRKGPSITMGLWKTLSSSEITASSDQAILKLWRMLCQGPPVSRSRSSFDIGQ